MDQQEIIASLESRARTAGLAMSEVCRRANIHPTTFSRWKQSEKNPDPIGATIKSLSALDDVLKQTEAASPDATPEAA
ncbi:MAG: transposase [Sphingomonadales bacterium]|nr:transposase [Sphingomonadales bacterium]